MTQELCTDGSHDVGAVSICSLETPKGVIGKQCEPALVAQLDAPSDWRPGDPGFNPHRGRGVVGWCEGAVYLTSLGRPTDIGLQLGKACYPCSG